MYIWIRANINEKALQNDGITLGITPSNKPTKNGSNNGKYMFEKVPFITKYSIYSYNHFPKYTQVFRTYFNNNIRFPSCQTFFQEEKMEL